MMNDKNDYRIVVNKKGNYYGEIRKRVFFIRTWSRFTFTEFDTVEECERFIAKKIERLKKEKEYKKQASKVVKYL